MPKGVFVKTDKVQGVLRGLRDLVGRRTYVGIPASSAGRQDARAEGRKRFNNAEIGYVQENGSPEASIPPRPHLVPGVRKAQPVTVQRLRDAAKAALDGRPGAVDKNLHAAGINAANEVKKVITDVIPPPLADSTLHARKHRKVAPRQGETPLIDTGVYRRSITHVVRKV